MAQTNGDGYATDNARVMTEQAREYEGEPYRPLRFTQERPLGDLFQELAQDARNLVQLEVALAKTELSEKAAQAGKGAAMAAAGGFVIYAGFLAIVFAAIAGLANFLAPWLAALIVGVVVILIGYVVLRSGMSNLKGDKLAPKQTIQSVKEDKEWVQNQVR